VQILQYKPSHENLPLMRDVLQASDGPLLDPGSRSRASACRRSAARRAGKPRCAPEVVAAYQRLAGWKQRKGFPTSWT
jgi:hypothetical protein